MPSRLPAPIFFERLGRRRPVPVLLDGADQPEKLRGLQLGAYAGLFTLQPTLENYANAFTAVPLGGYLLNTLIFSVATTAIMVVTTTLAAYAFARLRFRGRNFLFAFFLSMMMIPTELVVITNFVTITNLDLRNSFLGLVLPSITSVFYTYLLKENFEQVPDELYKAAKVDGTSDLKYLWKVMIPICR